MPTQSEALGFSNRWYSDGFINAVPYAIDERTSINIFSLPYFIASKLEAFKNRGKGDFRFSTDFEDIVYVLENGTEVERQLVGAPSDVKAYLKEQFSVLLENPAFEGHIDLHTAQVGLDRILRIVKQISR